MDEKIVTDPLFKGLTRPAMTCYVTFEYLVIEVMIVFIPFLMVQNLFMLLALAPLHAFGMAAYAWNPRFFEQTFRYLGYGYGTQKPVGCLAEQLQPVSL